jgi:hypothetical protein
MEKLRASESMVNYFKKEQDVILENGNSVHREEPKQETLEEVKKYLSNEGYGKGSNFTLNNVANLMLEWQQEQDKNKYSEEEVLKAQQAILCNIKDALMNENYIIEYLNNLKTNKI